ncbi:MAG: DUF4173 domain-containing protein [Acidobacteriia bacterium]|nr:DUF4173 domain-containing protein [Terriglobia bacterium]
MSERTKVALRIVAVALVLGALGDALLREIPWGLNFFLWVAALTVVVYELSSWRPESLAGSGRWLLLPLFAFAAAFLWRDSLTLKLLNILALLVAFSLILFHAQGGRVKVAGLTEYALGGVIAGINAAFAPFFLLLGDIQWKEVQSDRLSRRTFAVGRGVLLSLPLLLIFGGLLVAADAVFKVIVTDILRINFDRLILHACVTGFCAWIAAGYLRGALLGKDRDFAARQAPARPTLGIIEIGTVLALLDLLFFAFVLVQLRYFFGGAALVQATMKLTYAEYARRGFFELVTVTALALPLLLFAHWLLRKDDPRADLVFQFLAGGQLLLLAVIMVSAIQRMRLYQREYGLTEQRLYPTAFMAWLAVVFVWFALTVLRGHRERFAFGAMMAGFVLVATLHVLNPDALIVRANAAHAGQGHRFDAHYVSRLSADAVPDLIAVLPRLAPSDQCIAAGELLRSWSPAGEPDWRTWNYSRTRAVMAVQQNATNLRQMTCSQERAGQ